MLKGTKKCYTEQRNATMKKEMLYETKTFL